MRLFPQKESGWSANCSLCSAVSGEGIGDIWENINDYLLHCKTNDYFEKNRKNQTLYWLHESIRQELQTVFHKNEGIVANLQRIEGEVAIGKKSVSQATTELIAFLGIPPK